ncbi:MAG: DUF373 family protein [Nitrososphaerales archaeon]
MLKPKAQEQAENEIDATPLSPKGERMLVLCIDRDNDIGLKAGVETPIIGRQACIESASKLALADPEEADANTIFAAVKEYDNLVSKGEICEIATVAGLFERGVLGDRKIRNEVSKILKGFPAEEAIIISDGAEGEELTPLISSLVTVVSIQKVTIKHSKSVEESYQVLGRYLRMLLFDKRYSRYALGLPGLIIIGLAIGSILHLTDVFYFLAGIIGIAFVIRGFNVDREIESIRSLSAAGYMRLFAVIISVFVVLGGVILGILPFFATNPPSVAYKAATAFPNDPLLATGPVLGYFIQGSQFLVWLGLGVYIVGALFFNVLRPKERHILRNVVALIVLGLLYYPVFLLGQVLIKGTPQAVTAFVGIALFALAVNFAIAAYVYSRYSKRRSHTDPQSVEV